MNKKFLSAILFGALMVTSTGTFVSCKDYDDDIENLQGQISANASAIAELKTLVQNSDYVTNVAVNGNNLVVTFKNAGSQTLALPECEDEVGSLAEVKDNELYIDGKATGIKVAETAAEFQVPVKIVDGEWAVLQEDGTYLSTNIPASGVTAVQNADKSWTLTITDAEGNTQEVKVPSAATLLSDLMLFEGAQELNIVKYDFNYNYNKHESAPKRDKWAGPKSIPAEGDIYAGVSSLAVQINPTTVDAAELDLTLVDSKNKVPSNLNLAPAAYTGLLTRAANPNGLYTLGMSDVYFANAADGTNKASSDFYGQFFTTANDEVVEKRYAVTAGTTIRSEYEVTIAEGEEKELTTLNLYRGDNKVYEQSVGTTAQRGSETTATLKLALNSWYTIKAVDAAALYDMHMVVDADDKTLFGFEAEEKAGYYAFRITRTPDAITKAAIKLTIQTVDKEGAYEETSLWIGQSNQISGTVTYDAITHLLSKNNDDASKDKNFFQISLDKMKESLGTDGLAMWNNKVAGAVVYYYNAAMDKVLATSDGDEIDAFFVSELKGNLKDNKAKDVAISSKAAKNMIFAINNESAAEAFEANKQYYAYVIFYNADGETLNSILVPFTFELPALSDLFVIDPGFIKDDVVNLYLYADDAKVVHTSGAATFMLSRVFEKYDAEGMTIALDNKVAILPDLTSFALAHVNSVKSNTTDAEYVNVKENTLAYLTLTGDLGKEKGYDQVLKLYITGKYDNAWSYGDAKFNFEAKIMSPIEKGNVVAKEGNKVTIKASDLNGFKFGNSLITGYTYNNEVSYKVLPNALGDNGENAWTRNDIKAVYAESGNTRYFTVENEGDAYPATEGVDEDGKAIVVDGYFQLKGYQVDHTVETTIKVKVTDIWNRSKTSEVPVKITVAE